MYKKKHSKVKLLNILDWYQKIKLRKKERLPKKVDMLKVKIKKRKTKEKKFTAKCLKELHEERLSYLERAKDPLTIGKAIEFKSDIFPGISLILNLTYICPAIGAFVERSFPLLNWIMNKWMFIN